MFSSILTVVNTTLFVIVNGILFLVKLRKITRKNLKNKEGGRCDKGSSDPLITQIKNLLARKDEIDSKNRDEVKELKEKLRSLEAQVYEDRMKAIKEEVLLDKVDDEI